MTTNRPLKVFLCHSSTDKPAVRELYDKLDKQGIDVWLDEKKLLPGQKWKEEIPKAVHEADAVIVCLSTASITKEGYVQREIKFALDFALEKPEGTIYLIPARLEDCEVPDSLSDWHWVDLFNSNGVELLFSALNARMGSLGIKFGTKSSSNLLYGGMELMHIPAGKFIMGSPVEDIVYEHEKPQHTVELPYDYWMARYPVTNAQYNVYVKAKGIEHPDFDWQRKKNHPICHVTWYDAMEYCKWLNNLVGDDLPSGLVLRLPTEAEWEKAARGADGRIYPWGNEFDPQRCHSTENALEAMNKQGVFGTAPVDYYSPKGDSPYGCADMAGNSCDWTHSKFIDYPYNSLDGREDDEVNAWRVLRGGSWVDDQMKVRAATREYSIANLEYHDHYGIRICLAPPLST